MLSKRPRSVGATTLLGEGEVGVGEGSVLKVPGVGASALGVVGGGIRGPPPAQIPSYNPSPPDVPQQQQLCGLVQNGQQGPHQVLHAALVHVLQRQAPQVREQQGLPELGQGRCLGVSGGAPTLGRALPIPGLSTG